MSSSLPSYSALPSRSSGEGSAMLDGIGLPAPSPARKLFNRRFVLRIIGLSAVIVIFVAIFAPKPEVVQDAFASWRVCNATPAAAQVTPTPALAALPTVTQGIHVNLATPLPGDSSLVQIDPNGSKEGQRPSKIIKLTFQYGAESIDPTGQKKGMHAVRDQIIDGHIEHARIHGYRQYVQHTDIMGDIMTKHATTLQVLLEELQKPKDKRAEWLIMHDADMIVFNYQFPLEALLPPPERTDIHLMGTRDGNGFNSGCLYIRVSTLMAQLFGGNIMYDLWPANREWNFAEQGMLANMIYDLPIFNQSSVIVPKHWVNAYPPGWEGEFRAGDWIMHTVAWSKAQLPEHVKTAQLRLPENQISPAESGIEQEAIEFWRKDLADRKKTAATGENKGSPNRKLRYAARRDGPWGFGYDEEEQQQ